ncbi:hypothetical protein Thermo_00521 [Thermoplasmatales archaeon]|nr:hypothetical protein Thermo_00521 [Thermoplasmatales archaeon]
MNRGEECWGNYEFYMQPFSKRIRLLMESKLFQDTFMEGFHKSKYLNIGMVEYLPLNSLIKLLAA